MKTDINMLSSLRHDTDPFDSFDIDCIAEQLLDNFDFDESVSHETLVTRLCDENHRELVTKMLTFRDLRALYFYVTDNSYFLITEVLR